jgi:small acid-soluble spore protein (thioredoxin-like protein)
MKHNPDNRKDNVEKIQRNINSTLQNIELGEEMIAKTDDTKMAEDLKDKNKRRKNALKEMKHEIRDEAMARKKGNL